MGSVLIDNISLNSALNIYMNGDINFKRDLTVQNYLYGIVLWDSIFSVEKRKSRQVDNVRTDDFYIDERFHIINLDFDYHEIDNEASDIAFDIYEDKANEKELQLIEDVFFYFLLSQNLNMNLLLSTERSEFAVKEKILEKLFDRMNLLGMLEKEVKEYYDELNNKIGKNLISFECPLLVDYICSNCSNLMEAIELAEHIRNEKDVIEFRKAMDEMGDALCEGNLILFNEYISAIPEIVSEITKHGEKSRIVNLGLSPFPSITTPIEIECGKKKLLHIDFLTDLGMYGLYNRFSNSR